MVKKCISLFLIACIAMTVLTVNVNIVYADDITDGMIRGGIIGGIIGIIIQLASKKEEPDEFYYYKPAVRPSERPVISIGSGFTANTLKKGEYLAGFGMTQYGVLPFCYGITNRFSVITDILGLIYYQMIGLNYNLINGPVSMSVSGLHIGQVGWLSADGLQFNSSFYPSKRIGIHASIGKTLLNDGVKELYNSNGLLVKEEDLITYTLGAHVFISKEIQFSYQIQPNYLYSTNYGFYEYVTLHIFTLNLFAGDTVFLNIAGTSSLPKYDDFTTGYFGILFRWGGDYFTE